jgi:hypothetical protein
VVSLRDAAATLLVSRANAALISGQLPEDNAPDAMDVDNKAKTMKEFSKELPDELNSLLDRKGLSDPTTYRLLQVNDLSSFILYSISHYCVHSVWQRMQSLGSS